MGKHTSDGSLAELRSSRPWTEREARRVIAAWEASGETVGAFARKEGLVAQRVYWWRGRLGRAGEKVELAQGAETAAMPAFVPVTMGTPVSFGTSPAVAVCVRDGVRVEVAELDVASVAWVAALVRALEEVRS